MKSLVEREDFAAEESRCGAMEGREEGNEDENKVGTFGFGATAFRDYLDTIEKNLSDGNAVQAEVNLSILKENLERQGRTPPPAYKGHSPTPWEGAAISNATLPHIQAALSHNAANQLDLAAREVKIAHDQFRNSDWYPPMTPKAE
jgi:hypothetical protein